MEEEAKINVLLIEDNPGDARLLREALAGINGKPFGLEWADLLSKGLDVLTRQKVDVVILDLTLPDSKGLNSVDKLHTAAPWVPVVVLTGLDDENTGLEAVRRGAQDYLVKEHVGWEGRIFARVMRYAIERKQVEERLQKASLELERSNKELEQFAYIASHDLKEPLRMVTSYAQLLSKRYRGKLDADADEFISYMMNGTNHMRQLIDDLLAYARVGTRGKEFEPVNCDTIVDVAISNLQMAIKETGALVTHDALPTVVGDDVQLSLLFQNLIGNAIKFHGPEPPHVHLSAARNAGEWLFSVRDNGIGIDPQHKEVIFVIFQRLHGKAEYPGTGMGLAICKKIVERHGGRIWVESEPGKGSAFYFSIPARGGRGK